MEAGGVNTFLAENLWKDYALDVCGYVLQDPVLGGSLG
jgi:hypothetical protein